MSSYDMSASWNQGVIGTQVLPLINDDAPVIRVEAGPGTGKLYRSRELTRVCSDKLTRP